MEIDWPIVVPTSISAIAACFSIVYAGKSKKLQTNLIENKYDIEQLSGLIETLKVASAIFKYPHEFSDDSFMKGSDLNEVPSVISKLKQNKIIATELGKTDWSPPIDDIENKIKILENVRKKLI